MAKNQCTLIVRNIQILKGDLIYLDLEGPLFAAGRPQPGQFVEVAVDKAKVLLNRPFSIYNATENSLELLVKPLGRASEALSTYVPGDSIRVIGAMGNGFPGDVQGKRILLVGGGIGIAPMRYYAIDALAKGAQVEMLFGNQTDPDQTLVDILSQTCPLHLCTDDGSRGHHGFVSTHTALTERPWDMIAVCGPSPMMRAVAAIARTRNIPCFVSLENTMACGLGACLCCVEPTTTGNRCVCTDGPVFNIDELTW